MILGNSDLGVLRYLNNQGPEAWRALKQFGLLRWNARNLTAENFRFLSGLPEQRVVGLPGTHPIRLVHGSPRDPFESICPENDISVLDLSLEMIAEPVMACGHTHEPWHLSRNGKLAVNPGAVTGPLNGEVGAQYAQLEWLEGAWQVKLKTIAYDLALIRNAFVETGLLDGAGPIGRCFLLSIETGRDVSLDFLTFAYKLAEQVGIRNGKTFSDEIWDLADRQYLWSKWTVNNL
jgi:predicted phosphodiesterase